MTATHTPAKKMKNYFGTIPYKGKLEVVATSDQNFIGLIKITALSLEGKDSRELTQSLGTGNIEYMYFKDYTIGEDGTAIFEDLNVNPEKNYYFYMTIMRIPSTGKYLLYTDNDGLKNQNFTKKIPIGKMYFGLTLLNIHEEGRIVRNNESRIEESSTSLSRDTFILPNEHYTTPVPLPSPSSYAGGGYGCVAKSFFGSRNRISIFQFGTSKFFLTIGTENTINFCEITDNEENFKIMIDHFANPIKEDNNKIGKLGLKITEESIKYITSDEYEFLDNYGVHIISSREGDKPNWISGYYKVRNYA